MITILRLVTSQMDGITCEHFTNTIKQMEVSNFCSLMCRLFFSVKSQEMQFLFSSLSSSPPVRGHKKTCPWARLELIKESHWRNEKTWGRTLKTSNVKGIGNFKKLRKCFSVKNLKFWFVQKDFVENSS